MIKEKRSFSPSPSAPLSANRLLPPSVSVCACRPFLTYRSYTARFAPADALLAAGMRALHVNFRPSDLAKDGRKMLEFVGERGGLGSEVLQGAPPSWITARVMMAGLPRTRLLPPLPALDPSSFGELLDAAEGRIPLGVRDAGVAASVIDLMVRVRSRGRPRVGLARAKFRLRPDRSRTTGLVTR